MTIKMGDCAPTACHVHLTQPQKALMFTQEGTDDLQPDTLSPSGPVPDPVSRQRYRSPCVGNGEIT